MGWECSEEMKYIMNDLSKKWGKSKILLYSTFYKFILAERQCALYKQHEKIFQNEQMLVKTTINTII